MEPLSTRNVSLDACICDADPIPGGHIAQPSHLLLKHKAQWFHQQHVILKCIHRYKPACKQALPPPLCGCRPCRPSCVVERQDPL